MTFRGRLVVATTIAVVVAILLASLAAYFATEHSLVASLDATLSRQAAFTNANDLAIAGDLHQVVLPNGQVVSSSFSSLPIEASVLKVAQGHAAAYFTTVSVQGTPWREYVYPGTITPPSCQLPAACGVPVALQLATALAPVNSQLSNLRLVLGLVAIAGIALAVLLGWLVGRTALQPLNTLTGSVEEMAETTDVSRRLDPGGVDELGRLRRAFNHLLGALERSRESQRLLVQDAAHELRTPLTSLRTNMEVARRLEELPVEDRQVLVDDVLAQLDELTNLVSNLAELARGERHEARRTAVRLDQLVEDSVALAATHGRPRDIRLALSTAPTAVIGRPDRIERAVGNLLDNALKWSPQGGTVEISCQGSAVVVRDHGPGISPEDIPHIFDRFYRAPAARGLPGSGLGLAIVAQVATDEGGAVSVTNAPDGGAIFQLSFRPATDAHDAAADGKTLASDGHPASDGQHPAADKRHPEDLRERQPGA